MIISKAPFRVSFCGGGSDIPVFYEKYGGCVLSCSINKYVYIALHPSFDKHSITLKYTKTEHVLNFDEIEHKYFKIMLQNLNVKGVEITSIADIPAGTGLGSSSAFTVAVINALNAYKGIKLTKEDLAFNACDVEINKAKSPIGKQDQYASAFGGLNFITFEKNGKVLIEPVQITPDTKDKLENNILMFYTGLTHDANSILSEQSKNLSTNDNKVSTQLAMCHLTRELKEHLENGDVDFLGIALKKSWEMKKTLSENIANPIINDIYEKALSAGADGGKLLGAGGGGFLLFYVKPENQSSVRKALGGYSEIKFKIDFDGASIVYDSK